MMLKVLAIVVGIIVAATRLPGVVMPEFVRKMIKFMLDRRAVALVMMVVAAVIGSLFVWGFRLYVDQNPSCWQAVVLLVLGIVMTVMALVGLVFPNAAFSLASKIHVVRSSTMRLLCLLGVIIGAAIIWLGIALPT